MKMKISVVNVLSETMQFCKKNIFKVTAAPIILLSYYILSTIFYEILPVFSDVEDNTLLQVILLLVSVFALVAIVAYLINIPKLDMTLNIQIDNRLSGIPITFREAYYETGGKYWLYVGCTFLLVLYAFLAVLVLILLLAIIAVILSIFNVTILNNFVIGNFSNNYEYATVFMYIFNLFITSLYFVLIPVIALEDKMFNRMPRARELIKGNYLKAVLLTLITSTGISLLYTIISSVFSENRVAYLIINIFYYIIFFFFYIFAKTASVIVYRKLTENEIEVTDPVV